MRAMNILEVNSREFRDKKKLILIWLMKDKGL